MHISSYLAKVTAVVEAVMGLPDGAKCLIFSQWDDMLSLLAKALEANGVAHRRLQGALRPATLCASLYHAAPPPPCVIAHPFQVRCA